MIPGRFAFAGLCCAVALSGCGGSSPGGGSADNSAAAGSSASAGNAAAAIKAANFASAPAMDALVNLATDPAAAQAAEQTLASGATGAQRWAAVYLYMNTGTDPKVLAPYLTSSDLTLRTMAATGEVLMGSASGFPVLIATLGQPGLMEGSAPLQSLWQFAAEMLVTATANSQLGPPFDSGSEAVLAARGRWEAWWEANRARLHWNASQQLWSTS